MLPKGKVFDSMTPRTSSLHFYFSFLTLTNIYLIRNKSHTCFSFESHLEIKKQFDLTSKRLTTVFHSRQKVQRAEPLKIIIMWTYFRNVGILFTSQIFGICCQCLHLVFAIIIIIKYYNVEDTFECITCINYLYFTALTVSLPLFTSFMRK